MVSRPGAGRGLAFDGDVHVVVAAERDDGRECRRADAGEYRDALEQAIVQSDEGFAVRISRLRRDHRSDQHVRRFEAKIRRLKPQERSKQQAAPYHHHERDRDLCDDESAPCPLPVPLSGTPCAVLESLPKRMARRLKGRHQAEQDAGSECDRGGERQNVPIDLGPSDRGQIGRQHGRERVEAPGADEEPEYAAAHRKQQTLGEQLSNHSRPRRAPRASRTAISRRRLDPRASSRFATLAQAMRSTKPTAASSTSSDVRMSPTICSWSGTDCERHAADWHLDVPAAAGRRSRAQRRARVRDRGRARVARSCAG